MLPVLQQFPEQHFVSSPPQASMALHSMHLSSSHHNAYAPVPWATAVNLVGDAETMCSSIVCTHGLLSFGVFTCSILQ